LHTLEPKQPMAQDGELHSTGSALQALDPVPASLPHETVHDVPASHLMGSPLQSLGPVHAMLQTGAAHSMPLLHDEPPSHPTEQEVADWQSTPPPFRQLDEPEQAIAHVPASQATPWSHAELPEHSMLQDAPEQATTPPLHALDPVQRMSHAVDFEQSTPLLHGLPLPLQATAHGTPGGQGTGLPSQALPVQANVHQPPSQAPPASGQTAAQAAAASAAASGAASVVPAS
jgi:hypothetical protein